jgi:hypothetical protein
MIGELRDSVNARAARGALQSFDTDDPCGTGSAICTHTQPPRETPSLPLRRLILTLIQQTTPGPGRYQAAVQFPSPIRRWADVGDKT